METLYAYNQIIPQGERTVEVALDFLSTTFFKSDLKSLRNLIMREKWEEFEKFAKQRVSRKMFKDGLKRVINSV